MSRARTLLQRRPDGRPAGQALVEFALVLPIFILLLLGLIDLGRTVYIYNAISQGAREGARWGSVAGRAESATTRDQIRTRTVNAMSAVPSPTVSVGCERAGAAHPTCRPNDILVVTVESRVTMLTPVLSQIVGPVRVAATSKVRVNH